MFATTANPIQVTQFIQDAPSIQSIGTAIPQNRYSQAEICQSLGIDDEKLKKFFSHQHIQHRHLYLGHKKASNSTLNENFVGKNYRFVTGAIEIGQQAALACINNANINCQDIDFVCCVTSTGFIVPSLSALIIKKLGLRQDCQRIDIVGMGCSAGLNGLQTVANWAKANPNQNALLICVEICSAIYTPDNSVRTAVVNSLFGDGAAAALIRNNAARSNTTSYANDVSNKNIAPQMLGFESFIIPSHSDELRFDWDEKNHAYSFYVGKQTPRVMAGVIELPLENLLTRFKLQKTDIKYWILHGGGEAVLNGIKNKLNLTEEDIQYTREVLQHYGNLSSGSFLFSYSKLIANKKIHRGTYGIMITLGPGLAIEMALIKW